MGHGVRIYTFDLQKYIFWIQGCPKSRNGQKIQIHGHLPIVAVDAALVFLLAGSSENRFVASGTLLIRLGSVISPANRKSAIHSYWALLFLQILSGR